MITKINVLLVQVSVTGCWQSGHCRLGTGYWQSGKLLAGRMMIRHNTGQVMQAVLNWQDGCWTGNAGCTVLAGRLLDR